MGKSATDQFQIAECPFYIKSHNLTITCEDMKTTFDSKKDRSKYNKEYCGDMHKCQECENYKKINLKYAG